MDCVSRGVGSVLQVRGIPGYDDEPQTRCQNIAAI